MAGPPRPGLAVLDDDRRLGVILSPLRRQILDRLRQGPRSATELARELALPRQKVNYHVRTLERAGFLELDEERQRRGCVERSLRVTARAWVIDPSLLGELGTDPEAVEDRFSSSYLLAVAARLARDVATLRARATRARKSLPTFTLEVDVRFPSAAARAAFADELTAAVARLAQKHHDDGPGSRAFRFLISGHPVVAHPKGKTGEQT